jgi:short-subunit dehydrogenase
MNISEKYILITGGTRGIGRSFFKELVNRGGKHFALLARHVEPAEELQKEHPEVEVLPVSCDLNDPRAIDEAVETIRTEWGKLDVLINNAGVVSAGALEEISDDDIIRQVNINLTGLILLTKKCLPLLKASKEGALINVSSGLGYIAWPFYSVYAATKAGVRQFSDAMRRDLPDYPIHVMTVYPTSTDTPMMTNAKVDRKMDDPDMVARESIAGWERGDLNVIFGGEQRLRDIETNFHHPRKIDEKAKERYEQLRIRTETHRAM